MNIAICTDCHLAARGRDTHELGYTPPVQPLRRPNCKVVEFRD